LNFFHNKLFFNHNYRHQLEIQGTQGENNMQSVTTNDSINHKDGIRLFIKIRIQIKSCILEENNVQEMDVNVS
jgi:hypothetical protein